jgi:hypothetical protein
VSGSSRRVAAEPAARQVAAAAGTSRRPSARTSASRRAIAAISRSAIAAYNPILWVRTLSLFGSRSIVGAAVFYALLLVEAYLVTALAPLRSIPVAGAFVIRLVAVIAMAMRARVLGAVCEPYFRQ